MTRIEFAECDHEGYLMGWRCPICYTMLNRKKIGRFFDDEKAEEIDLYDSDATFNREIIEHLCMHFNQLTNSVNSLGKIHLRY